MRSVESNRKMWIRPFSRIENTFFISVHYKSIHIHFLINYFISVMISCQARAIHRERNHQR